MGFVELLAAQQTMDGSTDWVSAKRLRLAVPWGVNEMLNEPSPPVAVALTSGRRGSTVYVDGRAQRVPPRPAVEVDPTGAGDCFDAAFLCGLLEGRSLETCGRMAAAAGALNAAAFGPMEGRISRTTLEEVMVRGYVDA